MAVWRNYDIGPMRHEEAVKNLAVEQYLLGEMPAAEREAFEEHYFECTICADELRTAATFASDVKAIFAANPEALAIDVETPVRPRPVVQTRPGWNWLSWLQPQAAAFALAGITVISLGAITTLWRQVDQLSSPRIVNTAVLQGQTRGTAPVLNAPAGASVLLKFDLPDISASRLHYLVESSSGAIVYEISQDAPPLGEQVNLLIPKLNLPEGAYRLLVRAEGAGQDLAQYPFQVRVGKEAN